MASVTSHKSLLIALSIFLILSAACTKKNAPAKGTTATPSMSADPTAASSQDITGPVVETMDAGTYTYVRVTGPNGDVWAAAQRFDVKVGDRVVIRPETPMRNFHSQTLNRDFPLIYFTTSIRKEGETAPAPSAQGGMMASHGASPAPGVTVAPIAQPAGAMSVADVWTQRKSLAGRIVTVKGKVVKFNPEIMGRNWVHIQDGSGKAADGTNDLTITTNDETQVGDVITVTSTVSIDKDFTAGYAYPVMLENAKIAKK
jgi:hypothetical protein